MKLLNNINPKRLFGSSKKKSSSPSRQVSRSDHSSLSTASTSSSDSSNHGKLGASTPTSVLQHSSLSTGWSGDVCLELAQAFKLVDGKVKISKEELELILSRVCAEQPARDELLTMLSEADGEVVSVEEFGSVFGQPACGSELRDAFDFFDADHDGRITAEELLRVFTTLGDDRCTLEDCKRMIAEVDDNKDGFVCFEDFKIMMDNQQQR